MLPNLSNNTAQQWGENVLLKIHTRKVFNGFGENREKYYVSARILNFATLAREISSSRKKQTIVAVEILPTMGNFAKPYRRNTVYPEKTHTRQTNH